MRRVSLLTSAQVTGTPGTNGWYKSDVAITLTSTDDNAGVLETKYSINGGEWKVLCNLSCPSGTLPSPGEGKFLIEYYSIDRAGNNENIHTLSLNIDKIPPEIRSEFNPTTKDFSFSAQDSLDPSPSIGCNTNTCTAQDQAGNTTILKYQKITALSLKNLKLLSISYNGTATTLSKNLFTVAFVTINNQISSFAQTFLDEKNRALLSLIYIKPKNQTVVITWLPPAKPVTQTVAGVKYLQLSTNNGSLKAGVK